MAGSAISALRGGALILRRGHSVLRFSYPQLATLSRGAAATESTLVVACSGSDIAPLRATKRGRGSAKFPTRRFRMFKKRDTFKMLQSFFSSRPSLAAAGVPLSVALFPLSLNFKIRVHLRPGIVRS